MVNLELWGGRKACMVSKHPKLFLGWAGYTLTGRPVWSVSNLNYWNLKSLRLLFDFTEITGADKGAERETEGGNDG